MISVCAHVDAEGGLRFDTPLDLAEGKEVILTSKRMTSKAFAAEDVASEPAVRNHIMRMYFPHSPIELLRCSM